MRRLVGLVLLAGGLSLTALAPSAAAQSYGPGLGADTWYGPYAAPYGGIGASGFGSTGWGCGLGAYGFTQYGYGTVFGLGPGMPTCGGFGAYPYLFPYYTGYPFSNGVGAQGSIALSGIANSTPGFATAACNGLGLGGAFTGNPTVPFPGAAGQFTFGNNFNLLNLNSPVLPALSNFGTLGTQGFTGCVGLR